MLFTTCILTVTVLYFKGCVGTRVGKTRKLFKPCRKVGDKNINDKQSND